MMEGLDGSFDAAFLVSYHGSISAQTAVLSHTYNPSVVYHAELNGHVVGESGINALVARHYDVPIALITGDDATAEEMRRIAPDCECVVVKRSITRFAAESLHPEVACERIRAGAARALERLGQMGPPAIDLPATLEVQVTTSDYAELGSWLPGVERTGPRSLRLVDDEPLRMYRTWVAFMAHHARDPGAGVSDRVALVTGAAGGIGSAIAARLAREGFRVACSDLARGGRRARRRRDPRRARLRLRPAQRGGGRRPARRGDRRARRALAARQRRRRVLRARGDRALARAVGSRDGRERARHVPDLPRAAAGDGRTRARAASSTSPRPPGSAAVTRARPTTPRRARS